MLELLRAARSQKQLNERDKDPILVKAEELANQAMIVLEESSNGKLGKQSYRPKGKWEQVPEEICQSTWPKLPGAGNGKSPGTSNIRP